MLPVEESMTQKLRDPELDRLVNELNQQDQPEEIVPQEGEPATAEDLDAPLHSRVQEGEPLDTLLVEMGRQGASDLLVLAEAEVMDGEEVGQMFKPHLGGRSRRDLDARGSADFSLRLAAGRELDE